MECLHSLCTIALQSQPAPVCLILCQACCRWPQTDMSEGLWGQHSIRSPPSSESNYRSSFDSLGQRPTRSYRLLGRKRSRGTRISLDLRCPKFEDLLPHHCLSVFSSWWIRLRLSVSRFSRSFCSWRPPKQRFCQLQSRQWLWALRSPFIVMSHPHL